MRAPAIVNLYIQTNPLEVIENVLNRKSQQWESEGNVDTLDENANNVDYSTAYYAPYHPKAAKLFRTLKKKFNIDCVYKKTTTLGNYMFGTLLMYAAKYLVANAQ